MNDILELIVPDYVLAHFDYESHGEESGVYVISLVEPALCIGSS